LSLTQESKSSRIDDARKSLKFASGECDGTVSVYAVFEHDYGEYISCAISLAEVPGSEAHISDSMFEISVKVCIFARCCK
jgi:hypothetical protein